jgi:hypothetical protein
VLSGFLIGTQILRPLQQKQPMRRRLDCRDLLQRRHSA